MANKSNVQFVRKVRAKKPKTISKKKKSWVANYSLDCDVLGHKNDIYFVKYPNGFYFVDFKNKSLGCTLKCTDNKKEAQEFFKAVSNMSKSQILNLLNRVKND